MARILLRFSHGLGDVVQFTVALKHLAKYRPNWVIDVRCGRGKHTALTGLCNRVYDDKEPAPSERYDSVIDVGWDENYRGYTDRPNSKITNFLREKFSIEYDSALGRYETRCHDLAKRAKCVAYLASIGCKPSPTTERYNAVVLHYQGNTSPAKKNLQHWQASALCEMAISVGRVPLILDWDNRSQLPDNKRVFTPGCGPNDIWGGFGSGDAETIAWLIKLSEAYVGIDSGPGKVASTTDTPSLICWIGHHPIQFHDPADNTTHLVPVNHRSMPPVSGRKEIGDYFEKHYRYLTYHEHQDLVTAASRWLSSTLGATIPECNAAVKFVLPNGIGDAVWALHKIKSVAKEAYGDAPIDIILSGDPQREINHRSVPFLKRFKFIRDVSVTDIPVLIDRQNPTDEKGRYRYEPDGERGRFHFLCPNGALERGFNLAEWLPQHAVDWTIINELSLENTERGTDVARVIDPFVAFYVGPEAGNVNEGHNRGFLWEPKEWLELGREFRARGMNICLVGASYDRSYYERYVKPGMVESGQQWFDLIGKLEIGETFSLLRRARTFISYQCGLGIVSHYLGVPVAMWWRPDGNSCHPKWKVCFDERMASGWTNPALRDRYLAMIYKRETVKDIIDWVDQKGWLRPPSAK